jgi:uncharacterized membrane protein (UPF0127 family)
VPVRIEREDGAAVCERCEVADRPLSRLKGLLGRAGLDKGEALLIRPASSIHTFFMRFPIDVVFVDRSLRIVGVSPNLPPWRVAARRRAHAVLELAAGECETRGIEPGTTLTLVPNALPRAGGTR